MFRRWRQGKSAAKASLGISLHREGAWGARLAPDGDRLRVEALAGSGAADPATAIAQLLRALDGRGLPLSVALDRGDYQLVQIEPPEVPEEELDEALRWQIRDLVDQPVDDLVIDHFLLPPNRRTGGLPMACVVAAAPAPLRVIAEASRTARLRAIDIPELVLRDLTLCGGDERIHGWVHLSPRAALVLVCEGDRVLLTRRIETVGSAFSEDADAARAMEELLLEVQRSLDYYQNLYGAAPVASLQVMGTSTAVEAAFVLSAAVDLAVPVARFEPAGLSGLERFDEDEGRHALLAIGAALREAPCPA